LLQQAKLMSKRARKPADRRRKPTGSTSRDSLAWRLRSAGIQLPIRGAARQPFV